MERELITYDELIHQRPNLFSASAVYITEDQFLQIQKIISAVENVARLKGYQRKILSEVPAIAHLDFGPQSVFMGYDFHLCEEGPKLIEINSNAGGALLNLKLARVFQLTGTEGNVRTPTELQGLEKNLFEMFLEEWKLQRGDQRLKTVAIIDDDPLSQYLYPEFELFKKLFESFGVMALIIDSSQVIHRDGKLWHNETVIDMVYNRLTDFYFEQPKHVPLRQAYRANSVVVTPHPRGHAFFANKRNLETLSSNQALTELGARDEDRETLLKGIPKTLEVTIDRTKDLWENRRSLFFKTATGYGSKAAYRGDKLTIRVWNEIIKGDYVAQTFAPPSKILIKNGEKDSELKVDIRAYVYQGKIQLMASRLYSGQTTNFRTPGGGFAPVFLK